MKIRTIAITMMLALLCSTFVYSKALPSPKTYKNEEIIKYLFKSYLSCITHEDQRIRENHTKCVIILGDLAYPLLKEKIKSANEENKKTIENILSKLDSKNDIHQHIANLTNEDNQIKTDAIKSIKAMDYKAVSFLVGYSETSEGQLKKEIDKILQELPKMEVTVGYTHRILYVNYVDNNGMLTGSYDEWSPYSDKIKDGFYKDGIPTGKWNYYFKSGKVGRTKEYKIGEDKIDINDIKYYHNGKIYMQSQITDSCLAPAGNAKVKTLRETREKVSERKVFYHSGKLATHSIYTNEGINFVWWYENGNKCATGSYVKGKLHGKVKIWYKNGAKRSEVDFINGEPAKDALYWTAKGKQSNEENEIPEVPVSPYQSTGEKPSGKAYCGQYFFPGPY